MEYRCDLLQDKILRKYYCVAFYRMDIGRHKCLHPAKASMEDTYRHIQVIRSSVLLGTCRDNDIYKLVHHTPYLLDTTEMSTTFSKAEF